MAGRIELVEGDITEQTTDAIVNAANSELVLGPRGSEAVHPPTASSDRSPRRVGPAAKRQPAEHHSRERAREPEGQVPLPHPVAPGRGAYRPLRADAGEQGHRKEGETEQRVVLLREEARRFVPSPRPRSITGSASSPSPSAMGASSASGRGSRRITMARPKPIS